MNRVKNIFFLMLLVSLTSFSKDELVLEEKSFVGKNRGIDVLNFYEPVSEQNSIRHYLSYEYGAAYSLVEWKIAQGYIALDEKWDFEYDTDHEFYIDDDLGNGSVNYNGWDSLVGFVKDTGRHNFAGNMWSTDFGIMWEYNNLGLPDESGGNYEKNEFALRYRVRTDADFGMGGTYWGFDFWLGKVFVTGRDGYSLEGNLLSATNWGHGWQTFNTLYNEYYDYGAYDGTYLLGLESITRWTYEYTKNWAFCFETEVDVDKFIGGTSQDYTGELTLYPHILYNREFYPNLRVFSKIGLPGYGYKKNVSDSSSTTDSGVYFLALIGVQYIW
ncbi:hypothetical protein [uncultured Ilyobacter sp.]|uniref:hypothetical protein n=1 Tax=uncultured Ilyobacter sp. TaxID=544433 RepID=UPI0029C03100|nr:hypothetical protein [uncultured Ilyobacter sp.]